MRGTETVTVLRGGQRDENGDETVGASAPRVIKGCLVWPRTSTEDDARGEVIIEGLNVFTPPGADVLATDRMVARGKEYAVVGEPGDYRLGGAKKGLLVLLGKVT